MRLGAERFLAHEAVGVLAGGDHFFAQGVGAIWRNWCHSKFKIKCDEIRGGEWL